MKAYSTRRWLEFERDQFGTKSQGRLEHGLDPMTAVTSLFFSRDDRLHFLEAYHAFERNANTMLVQRMATLKPLQA